MLVRFAFATTVVASVFMLAPGKLSADWPTILGPTRNGHADSNAVLPNSLTGTPKQVWKVEAGQGYAGPAIAGNDVVVFERIGDNDRVRLLQASSGAEVWKRELPAKYRGGIDSDKGPRCVPTILETSVLVHSAAGDVTLLSRKNGAVLWSRALRIEYEADDGYFGAGSTPLVFEDKVIVNVGSKTANVVCISLKDGKTLWKASSGEASYASPIVVTPTATPVLKSPIVVVPTRLKTFGLNPASGEELWSVPFGQRGPTVNAATPIVLQNGDIYLTASYGIGSAQIKLNDSSASIERKGDEISSQYATPVAAGNKIFGSDGREDGGPALYKCIDQTDGKVIWEKAGMPIAHTIAVGDKLLVLGIDGQVWAIAQDSPSFSPLWKTNLSKGVFRALPAFSGNRLLVRTSGGRDEAWYCFELQ